jgi:hypothetical protein
MWEAYADPDRWSEWAPQIRPVDAPGRLREGLEGTVTGLFGVRVRFRVTSVDAEAGRWAWEVRAGVMRLRIDHEVEDGRAAITIDGPAPAVLAYAPVARLALARLVSLT